MKETNSIKKIFILITLCLLSMQIIAQVKDKNKKASMEIMGNCGMCKTRIEKALSKVKGVKFANWDIPSKELTVVYDENKCTPIDIKKAIAKVGHDTDSEKASNEVYNKLPACCKFRDPKSLLLDHNSRH